MIRKALSVKNKSTPDVPALATVTQPRDRQMQRMIVRFLGRKSVTDKHAKKRRKT